MLEAVETGQVDELGNAVVEHKEIMQVKARFTPWTTEEIQLDSRGITKNTQRYVIPMSYNNFPKCSYILVNGVECEVVEIIYLSPRYTSVLVKGYKE